MNRLKAGSTINHLYQKDFVNFHFPIPPYTEQHKIASILGTVDDAINKYDEIIVQTKRLKQGLMQQLLTKGIGHEKFKKVRWYFGKTIEIPEEWKLYTVDDILDVMGRIGWKGMTTKDYREEGPILLGVTNISKNFILDLTKMTPIFPIGVKNSWRWKLMT